MDRSRGAFLRALTAGQRAEINRANARKSTGPVTARGQANSAKNALKHGLTARTVTVVPGEDPGAHQAFLQEWLDAYQPATPGRRALVERGADVAWKLRRLARCDDARAEAPVRAWCDPAALPANRGQAP